ncbi:MAG: SGNH/GDSL hydrolase family protein [Bacteroidetes bacterium]|nr:SGNH/GDSL hydrolase family protein [Bacteroidota bacterium]
MAESPKKMSTGKLILLSSITMLIGFIFIFGLIEIIFRFNPQWVADPPAPPPHNYRVLDPVYGWHPQEGFKYQGTLRDKCDSSYTVDISFGKYGFRRWGNPEVKDRKKVLFVGDSYTACIQTGDEHLFYKIIGDSLSVEVFALGAAGFGSTQECMLMEKYIQEIRPDIVVWEVCCNDFLDNYWKLEEAAVYQVHTRRPYTLENGSIVYRTAARYPRNIKPYSYFMYFIFKRLAEGAGTFDVVPKEPAEKFIGEQDLKYPLFAKSVAMTDVVMKKVKSIIPPTTQLIAFDADNFNPQYNEFKRLFGENNIPFVDGLPDAVSNAQNNGKCVRSDDGYHWNNLGNAIVANYLINYLSTHQ